VTFTRRKPRKGSLPNMIEVHPAVDPEFLRLESRIDGPMGCTFMHQVSQHPASALKVWHGPTIPSPHTFWLNRPICGR